MKITIHEDDDATADFHVHKALISGFSAYFAALIDFREGKENTVKFVGMNIHAFRYVLTWLYQTSIEVLQSDVDTMI